MGILQQTRAIKKPQEFNQDTPLASSLNIHPSITYLDFSQMADTISSTRIYFDGGTKSWQQQNGLDDASLFANNLREGVNVIFTKLKPILKTLNDQNRWSSKLGIPDAFWSETSVRHNGYFGSSTFPYNKGKTLTRYDTTFRLIVKRLEPQKGPEEYDWLETSFFFRWTDQGSLLVCFDTPEGFPHEFKDTLKARRDDAGETVRKPYALHVILLDALVPIYDQSIWDLSTRIPGNVIERMASECETLAERENDDDAEQAMYERLEALRMHHSMILGVAARSTSNEKRLSNEISLAFNVMAQKDNDVNIGIARATRADSVAMKTIAIVTLTFLPATYVSAILGMNFFSYNPDTHGGHITYSPDLWLYFVVSIPLTIAVLTIWWVWQRREEMAEKSENTTEKAVKSAGTETSSSGSR
ncbi:hypothetical protein KCU78_g11097, partial [Aureobasidium melanogenum]